MARGMLRRDRDALKGALGGHVRAKFEASKAAWQPEFDRMLNCIRVIRGMPLCVDVDADGEQDAASTISYPVVPAIATAVLAVLRDVFGTAMGAPFTCIPTESPDLPPQVQEWLMGLLQQNLGTLEQMTGGDPVQAQQAIDGMLQAAKAQMQERAQDAANTITDEVKTRIYTAGWKDAFSKFLWNYVVYPVAVMKGPYLAPRKVRRWDPIQNRLIFEDEAEWVVETINPFSFLPAPYAADAQSCEYVIEVRRTTALEFAMLALVEGYDSKQIQQVQESYPDGHTERFWTGNDLPPDRDLLQFAAPSTLDDTGVYDILCFHGRVPGNMLNAMSNLGLQPWQWYEAEVQVVGDIVIAASLNGRPDGKRIFNSLAFEPIGGSIYGESVATRLFDTQRTCEATVREILRNMAYSSGPIGEVDITRVSPDDPWDILEPRMLKPVKPGMAGQNGGAYLFHTIENNVPQLQNVMEFFKNSGFEIIGFNRMSLGGMPSAGVGRTSGGMSMVLNQSSKPVKLKVDDLGDYIIVPVVQRFLDIILMVSPDPTIQGDIKVHPKGVDGLADNEAMSANILQAMATLGPVAQAMQQGSPIAPEMLNLFFYWAKLNNIPTGAMQNYSLTQAFAQSTGSAYQGGAGNPPPGGQMNMAAPPEQPLDGRSAAAMGAINTQNNMVMSTARGPGS